MKFPTSKQQEIIELILRYKITTEEQNQITESVSAIEGYLQDIIWDVAENHLLDNAIIPETDDRGRALTALLVNEVMCKLNTNS